MNDPANVTWPHRYTWLLIFVLAFALRAWHINADLPNLYLADEPHHLNIAAHFGTGDLNPHDFKYPTLWSYVLACLLGLLYVLEKCLGHISNTADFASFFFYSPTVFYWSARLVAAGFYSMGAAVLYQTGKRYFQTPMGWIMAGFLALSPSFYSFGRDATLNGIMVFFVCCAIYELSSLQRNGRLHDYVLSGLFLGLAISSHYIAAPLPLLLIEFHFLLEREKRRNKNLVLGLTAVAVGFLLGSPYFLLDWRKALSDLFSMGQLHLPVVGQLQHNELARRSHEAITQLLPLGKNLVYFLDGWGIGFILACVGIAIRKTAKNHWTLAAWTLPALITSVMFTKTYHGIYPRYSLAVFIPLIVPASVGLNAIATYLRRFGIPHIALPGTIFILFSWQTIAYTKEQSLPDTRTLAKTWVLEHVPQGSKILLMDPFNCPQLRMTASQVERLRERTHRLHHQRWQYYNALAHNHPGGGYEIYYWQRDLVQVEDTAERTQQAYLAQDVIDLNAEGIEALRKAKIQMVILRIDPNMRPPWLDEIENRFKLQASFEPNAQHAKGPILRIYTSPDYHA